MDSPLALWRSRAARLASTAQNTAVSAFVASIIHTVSHVSKVHPLALRWRRRVDVIRDVPYCTPHAIGSTDHLLDVYLPRERARGAPAVLYLHGGGFRSVDKELNWMMPLALARCGYVVFNINYRLAPKHPFPAAHVDAFRAWCWAADAAPQFDVDPANIGVAGDSAGANLAMGIVLAACSRRPEPGARAVFEAGLVPRFAAALCGLLEVRNARRLLRAGWRSRLEVEQLEEIERVYSAPPAGAEPDLVDPLRVLEAAPRLARPLPPFFASVGSSDPLLDDTMRLRRAAEKHGGRCEVRVYDGVNHAFQAILFMRAAVQSWEDLNAFVAAEVPRLAAQAAGVA